MSNEFYNYLIKLNEYERKSKLSNSLAVGLTDFEKEWGKYAKEFHFPYSNLEVHLDNHVLQIKLHDNNNIVFVGDVIKYKGEIILKGITMIASGDGSPQSGANIFIAIVILVACINPHEDVEFRKKIFSELGISDLKVGSKKAAIVKDFKYTVNFSQELGLWFSVSRYN